MRSVWGFGCPATYSFEKSGDIINLDINYNNAWMHDESLNEIKLLSTLLNSKRFTFRPQVLQVSGILEGPSFRLWMTFAQRGPANTYFTFCAQSITRIWTN
jgi:hypothetical protein